MASQALLLLGLLPLVHLFLFLASAASVQDLLRAHGLPPGLLPRSVESFSLDPASGLLEVRLDYPCYARFDSLVFFDRVVRGNLSYGGLHGVVGVAQEELFLWLPVREIVVADPSSGVIFFDIGVAHKQLSLSLFEYPPQCQPGTEGELVPGIGEGFRGRHEKGLEEER
ncbi:uncharacterized protein LOC103709876 [Phoenix dactylifera]|uniref:Uncharacterized protein LOC103709876 n=1 Tax=Phoenix dactylifera TaxID=42345 RepID=A0A8B8J689_PHODC|nr:uncharacterized protein LOC103709876 [Phoenix dactylifera]